MHNPRTSKLALWCFLILSIVATVWLSSVDKTAIVDWFYQQYQQSSTLALIVFAAVTLVSQLIVMPSGFLLLLLGGFMLGAWPATLIYSIIQVLTVFPVRWLAHRNQLPSGVVNFAHKQTTRFQVINSLNARPLVVGMILRLTPVIPSAVACLLSVWLKLSLGVFISATVLVCWVRPLIFSTIGERLPDIGRLVQLVS